MALCWIIKLDKGSVSQDFWHPLFHDSNPSRPLINGLKYFRILFFDFAEILEFLKSSAVCIPLRSWAPRCASYHRVKLRGVHPSAESSSTEYITPQSQVIKKSQKAPRCASHRRAWLRGVHPTTESSSVVCIPPSSLTRRCASHRGVNNLPIVCFDPKVYNCYFSVMPEDINMKIKL